MTTTGDAHVIVEAARGVVARAWDGARRSPWRDAAGWFVLALSIVALAFSLKQWADWQYTVAPPWSDWQTQANAVRRVLADAPLFAPEQLRGPYNMTAVILRGWTYPPASLVVLLPFAWDTVGLVAWVVVNVGLFLGGLAAILRRELGRFLPWPFALALLGLALFRPFAEGVVSGNVNVALAGVYALCWASNERRWWIAPAAGIAATFKVFPGLLALWPARVQGVRPIVIAAATAGALSLASLALVGIEGWQQFATVLLNAQPPCFSYNAMSIACLAAPVTGITIAKLLGYVVMIVLGIATLLVRDRFWAFVLLGGTLLAGVTDMHLHFWVFGYVVLVVWLARAYGRTRLVSSADAG